MNFIKIVSVTALLLPVAVHAMLGAAPGSAPGSAPGASRAALSAKSGAAGYQVNESRTDDGVTVREYTSALNVVFAVTWQGPLRPDMSALLGGYFPNFVAAGQLRPHGTGPLIGRNGELQIESTGHQGEFAGKAYVPRLVPVNVDVGQLQ